MMIAIHDKFVRTLNPVRPVALGMMDETDEVDVQKYVENPLLIDNR